MKVLLIAALVLPAIVHGSDWQDGWIAGWKLGWTNGWNYNAQPRMAPRGTFILKKGAWETGHSAGEYAGYWEGRQASQDYYGQGQPRTPGFPLAGLQAGQNFFGQGQLSYTAGFPFAGLANFGYPHPLPPHLVPIATHVASPTKTKGPTAIDAAEGYKTVSGDKEKLEGFRHI